MSNKDFEAWWNAPTTNRQLTDIPEPIAEYVWKAARAKYEQQAVIDELKAENEKLHSLIRSAIPKGPYDATHYNPTSGEFFDVRYVDDNMDNCDVFVWDEKNKVWQETTNWTEGLVSDELNEVESPSGAALLEQIEARAIEALQEAKDNG